MDSKRILPKTIESCQGWWSRGYLPHCDRVEYQQFVTIRLADALPASVHPFLREQRKRLQNTEEDLARQRRIDGWLDAGCGSCVLRHEEVALILVESFQYLIAQGHRIDAWVIMPNHVHLLIMLVRGARLSSVMRSFKGFTASRAHKVLGTKGSFWFPEYFDRYIRDAEHYEKAVSYIHYNPVRAGLVATPEAWRFGSAGWR